MKSLNKVLLIGNVSTEISVINATNGAFVSFNMATNKYNPKTRQSNPTFHSIVVFGENVSSLSQLLDKGDLVFVEGELSETMGKDGVKRTNIKTWHSGVALLHKKNNPPPKEPGAPRQFDDDIPY